MKKHQLLSIIAYYTGILATFKIINKRKYPKIIYYHDIYVESDDVSWNQNPAMLMSNQLFKLQLSYLKRRYDIVPLDEVLNSKSQKVIALTFDDGYRGIYRNVFPILKELSLPATVFIVKDFIGSSELPWWDNLGYQLKQFYAMPLEYIKLKRNLNDKWMSILSKSMPVQDIITAYKIASGNDRENLRQNLNNIVGNSPPNRNRIFLSIEEIKEMGEAGWSFGAHTKTHPILTWLSSEELFEELKSSKETVESFTRSRNCWFAYPDGVFSDREKIAVKKIGFTGALQTFRNPASDDIFSIPRIGVHANRITGITGLFSRAGMETLLAGLNKRELFKIMRSAI